MRADDAPGIVPVQAAPVAGGSRFVVGGGGGGAGVPRAGGGAEAEAAERASWDPPARAFEAGRGRRGGGGHRGHG